VTVQRDRGGPSHRLRSALGAVTVLAVTAAALFGGRTYLFCRAMNCIMSEPACCCAHVERSETGQAAAQAGGNCFEVRVVAGLVSFTIASDVAVAAASLSGVLPTVPLRVPQSAAVRDDGARAIRAGPFSPTASRANLMVFLT
jgi:hypothetical protein